MGANTSCTGPVHGSTLPLQRTLRPSTKGGAVASATGGERVILWRRRWGGGRQSLFGGPGRGLGYSWCLRSDREHYVGPLESDTNPDGIPEILGNTPLEKTKMELGEGCAANRSEFALR